jgi:hypothetical protein|tara:strand:+ start:4360 stop:5451 length:1092 start_codon:yes stop_codon:yes gene_type:complete
LTPKAVGSLGPSCEEDGLSRNADLDRLLEIGDLDGLLRLIDDLCIAGDWALLEVLASRGRLAVERGHQLWPAADHAEHRLALEAPGPFAAGAVMRDATRFGPAPLSEVVASSHQWEDLSPHLSTGPLRATVAHERVTRGEDLTGTGDLGVSNPTGLPFRLFTWEPTYLVPEIGPYGIEDPVPPAGTLEEVDIPPPGEVISGVAAMGTGALRDLARTWAEESNGHSMSVAVSGGADRAVATLLADPSRRSVRWRRLEADEAIGLMAWAGASGGAHGRRRGAARGRFEAWWCTANLAGLLEEPDDLWPPDPGQVGDAANEMNWWRWDVDGTRTGWHLNLAVEDPGDDLAWALACGDHYSASTPEQ